MSDNVPPEATLHDNSPILPDDVPQVAEAVVQSPDDSSHAQSSGSMINYVIIAMVFLIVGVLLGMNFDSGVDEETLRETVQEVVSSEMAVVLEDVMANTSTSSSQLDAEALQELVAKAIQDANKADSLLIGDDPYMGPEDAPVIIVEFSDFLCPFCGRHFAETLTPIMENYDGLIRYVYRDFPSVGGQNAVEAGMAAQCANEQDAFWAYHERLFSDQDSLRTDSLDTLRDNLISHAEALELDTVAFADCLDSDKYMADILQDASEGQQHGVRGTPAFFINGTFVSGAQPYEVFANIINSELATAGISVPGSNGDGT